VYPARPIPDLIAPLFLIHVTTSSRSILRKSGIHVRRSQMQRPVASMEQQYSSSTWGHQHQPCQHPLSGTASTTSQHVCTRISPGSIAGRCKAASVRKCVCRKVETWPVLFHDCTAPATSTQAVAVCPSGLPMHGGLSLQTMSCLL